MPPPRRTPRRTAARVAAAALAAAAVAAPATGGVPLVDATGATIRWSTGAPVPGTNVPERDVVTYFVGRGPTELPTHVEPVRSALRSWEVPTSRLRFREDATRAAAGRNGLDGVNWIGWVTSGLSPLTFAATFPTRAGTTLTDTDVLLNDRDFFWTRKASPEIGEADVESLVTHEWGHAIGLDHVPLRKSTMYFSATTGQVSPRSPEADDVAAVGSLYHDASDPADAFTATTATLRGRVFVAGTNDDRAVHVIATSVAGGEPAVSTLTRPDGTWRIDGLPAGAYRVVAAPCVPLGSAMNAYWRTGSTTFLPAVLGDPDAGGTVLRTVVLAPRDDAEVSGIALAAGGRPFEPNDAETQAAPVRLGSAVSARFETTSDQDWYSFEATAGDRVEVNVLAWRIGSDADPALRVTAPDGVWTAMSDLGPDRGSPEGEDRDARIVLPVAVSGTHRVRVSLDRPFSGSHAFYVLLVTRASEAPSGRLTTVVADPPRIDAGTAAVSEVVVRPRREDGADVGPGALVRVLSSRGATVAPAVAADLGDGTYRTFVSAAALPGRDPLTVTVDANVTTDAGPVRVTTTLPGIAAVVHVGPADASRSSLAALPRRVALRSGDAAPQTTLRFVPRDADGEALGPGREDDVSITIDPLRGSAAGAVADTAGEGVYDVALASGAEAGRATVTAAFRGQPLRVAEIGFGFGLADVLAVARADVQAFLATTGLPRPASAAFTAAGGRVARAEVAAADVAGGTRARLRALTSARSALDGVIGGFRRSKGRVADPGTVREIALALREAATEAVVAARANIASARDQRRVDAAAASIARGDAAFSGGAASAAAARWLAAWRRVAPLL